MQEEITLIVRNILGEDLPPHLILPEPPQPDQPGGVRIIDLDMP
jgi:hypothetical protein